MDDPIYTLGESRYPFGPPEDTANPPGDVNDFLDTVDLSFSRPTLPDGGSAAGLRDAPNLLRAL